MRIANQAVVAGSSWTIARPPRRKLSTSGSVPGFASRRTNSASLTIDDLLAGTLTEAQKDLAEHVAFRGKPVRRGGAGERIRPRDRNFQPARFDRPVQALELEHSRGAVVGGETDSFALPGSRLDSVGIGQPAAARLQSVEASRERLSADEGEDCVDAVRGEASGLREDVVPPPVDRDVGAEAAHESDAIAPGSGREHAGASELRELESEGADAARRAMHDHALSFLQIQRVVDPLERGQAGRRDGAGPRPVETARGACDFLRVHADQ